MARKTIVQITDDLDGSNNGKGVTFSFDGVEYEIDLSKKNRASFEKAIKPYVESARRVSKPATRRKTRSTDTGRDLSAVREWARGRGLKVSNRGRVPAAVIDEYDAAHAS